MDVVETRPGDLFVLTLPADPAPEEIERIAAKFAEQVNGAKLIILPAGTTLWPVSREAWEAAVAEERRILFGDESAPKPLGVLNASAATPQSGGSAPLTAKAAAEVMAALKAVQPGPAVRVFRDGAELPVRNGMVGEWKAGDVSCTDFDCKGFGEPIAVMSREGWFTLNGAPLAPGDRVNVVVPSDGQSFVAVVTEVDEDDWHFFKSDGGPFAWTEPSAATMTPTGGRLCGFPVYFTERLPGLDEVTLGCPPSNEASPVAKSETWRDRPPML